MSRRRLWLILGIALVAALAAGGAAALWHTPAFYAESRREDDRAGLREKQAKEFVQRASQLEGAVRLDERWSGEFTQDQINGFLAHDVPARYQVPSKVSEPRVRLSEGELDLAFRYRRGWWNGTVHVQVRPRVLGPTQVALEIHAIRAGAVPVPVAQPLDEIVRELRKSGWIVQWRPTKNGEVLVIDLAPHVAARVSLDGLELRPGVLRFAGHKPKSQGSSNGTAQRTAAQSGPVNGNPARK